MCKPLKFTQRMMVSLGFFLIFLMTPFEQSSFVILQKYSKILRYFDIWSPLKSDGRCRAESDIVAFFLFCFKVHKMTIFYIFLE